MVILDGDTIGVKMRTNLDGSLVGWEVGDSVGSPLGWHDGSLEGRLKRQRRYCGEYFIGLGKGWVSNNHAVSAYSLTYWVVLRAEQSVVSMGTD